MKKIKDFDKIQENSSGNFRLPDGGYIVGVKTVQDFPDKECLKLEVDVCRGEHKNFFQTKYDNNKNETKYWDNAGTLWRSYSEKSLPFFKGFITSVKKSNKNFNWNFEESELKNKIFGVVFASKEVLGKNGKVYTNSYIASVHSVEAIEKGDFTVPELRKLDPSKTATTTTAAEPYVDPFANDGAEVASAPVADSNPWDDSDVNPFA